VTFTEAGQLAKIGMNAAGIGLVVNNLISDQPRSGVPWIFINRRILESTHLTQAMGYVLTSPRAHSLNFLMAHRDGEGVNLETSPVEEHILWPENGLIVHTNHYLQPGIRFRDLKPLRDAHPSTYIRYRRARKRIADFEGHINRQSIQKVLTDHFDRPFSVCAHENIKVEPLQRMITCMSIILDLTHGEIYYTLGNPCQTDYHTLELQSYLYGS
jgi:isopenicillin-N N-acyltransferase-like protein